VLYSLLHVPYLVTIAGNLVVLGGIRFLVQRHIVFRGATGQEDAALSFDVELWDESAWMRGYLPEKRGDGGFRESMAELMQIIRAHGHRATFFVTARVVEEYPDVVERLAAEGHEVGVHGVAHVRLDTITDRAAFRTALDTMCERIEHLTGVRPRGFRAPHFSLHDETRWVLPILADLGFRYDSSVFPVRTPEYGVSGSPAEPYRISFDDVSKADHTSPLLEIPPSVAAFGPVRIPAAGGIYFRIFPLPLYIELLLWAGAPRVLYFHPHELYGDTPRIRGPLLKTILKYWGTRRAMRKFRRLCEQFHFDSIEGILSESI
jgi:polysaccharide deacetylase family protein (PEP-CTERM system associated)